MAHKSERVNPCPSWQIKRVRGQRAIFAIAHCANILTGVMLVHMQGDGFARRAPRVGNADGIKVCERVLQLKSVDRLTYLSLPSDSASTAHSRCTRSNPFHLPPLLNFHNDLVHTRSFPPGRDAMYNMRGPPPHCPADALSLALCYDRECSVWFFFNTIYRLNLRFVKSVRNACMYVYKGANANVNYP